MKLYKYCRYSEKLLATLAKNTIWLSSADAFNDIFDCQFKKTFLAQSQIDELKLIKEHRISTGGNRQVAIQILKKNNIDLTLDRETEYGDIAKFISSFGILCLSEIRDSLLLWAHYAENHSGVCIEYEINTDKNGLLPVNYSTQYPTLSIYDFGLNLGQTTDSILATKSMEWAYEKEWRYIQSGAANSEIPNPFKITSIIFGARMPIENARAIKAILKDQEIVYLKAVKAAHSFSIETKQF